MARMPGADWDPITVNYTRSGQVEVRGVVLHIMAGTLRGTNSWFRNPKAQASSHFGTGKQGELVQWVDTRDRAWTQGQGNRSWISIENEGKGGDALTDAQLDRCAQVLAWAHTEHGVPLQIATDPDGRGLGHHSMGGAAWGGHLQCPGAKVIAQKPEIIRRAKALIAPPKPAHDPTEAIVKKLMTLREGNHGWHVKTLHYLLIARGYAGLDGVDDTVFTAAHTAGVKGLQKAAGLKQTGVVDTATWAVLLRVA